MLSIQKRTVLCVAALLLAFAFPRNASAATIIFNGSGILTGADDVLVNGILYDVVFSEGDCQDAVPYNGCNEDGDFTFSTLASANAASQALLDQVFLDLAPIGPVNDFDSIPTLTFGCSSAPCLAVTPYEHSSGAFYASGASSNGVLADSVVALSPINRNTDFSTFADRTLAVWTLAAPESVPDQASSILLMALGLAGLLAARRW